MFYISEFYQNHDWQGRSTDSQGGIKDLWISISFFLLLLLYLWFCVQHRKQSLKCIWKWDVLLIIYLKEKQKTWKWLFFFFLQVMVLLGNSNITVIQQRRVPVACSAPWGAPVVFLKGLILLQIVLFTLCLNRVKRQLFNSYRVCTHLSMQLTNLKCLNCVQAAAPWLCLH